MTGDWMRLPLQPLIALFIQSMTGREWCGLDILILPFYTASRAAGFGLDLDTWYGTCDPCVDIKGVRGLFSSTLFKCLLAELLVSRSRDLLEHPSVSVHKLNILSLRAI